MKPQIVLNLLGQFQLTVDGQPIAGLTSTKLQALIAYLAVEQEQAHSREFLAELLWPDRPSGVARQNLRQTLSRLQRALPTEIAALLTISRNKICFNPGYVSPGYVSPGYDVQIDFTGFVRALEQVRHHQHDQLISCAHCCQKLATAVNDYRGDFLLGLSCNSVAFDEWRLFHEERLRQEMLQALDTLVQHHEAAQRWSDVYRFAWRSVEIDPLREVAHQQVMRALAHSGQRKAALDQYLRLTELLHDELGVEPATSTTALYETIRDQQAGLVDVSTVLPGHATAPQTEVPHNLPIQHTPFIGRRQELQRVAERLAQPECHLLTLVGPGGAGKTRLALEAATRQWQKRGHLYPDGIYFVALAAVEDGEQLVTAIAAALKYHFPDDAQTSAQRQAALIEHLQPMRCLLLLDNYEQLAESTDLLVAMLSEVPQIQLLVTSRVPLHLRAEWLLDIVGLTYPDAADLAPPALTNEWAIEARSVINFEAVQLFSSAACRVLADFTLSEQTAMAIGRLCFLTEGLPLALELAAAQVRTVPVPVLVEAVQQNLDTLATTMRDVPARHRSLRAVFDHSWRLLPPPLQKSFCRLALFRGTFTQEAAIAVTDCTADTLTQLIDYSLLREAEEHPTTRRYAMHEVLRQYAAEQLQQDIRDEQRTRTAHGNYYMTFVAEMQSAIDSHDTLQAVDMITRELDNIRAGWQWAATHCAETLLQQSISPLQRYFILSGQTEEGGHFADSALYAVTAWLDAHIHPVDAKRVRVEQLCAELHAMRARLFYKQARYRAGIEHAMQALRIAEACGADHTAALAALYWGICLLNLGEYAETEAKLTMALTRARSIAWQKIESDALRALGILADQQNNLQAARHYYEASLAISQEIDDLRGISASLGNVGSICRQQGDFSAAHRFLGQSLAIHRRIGDRSSEGRTLSMLGELSADLEEYPQAEQYFGEALHILRSLGEEHYAADALVSLGKVYWEQGRSDLAVACWQEAVPIYEATNEAPLLAKVREYLQLEERGSGVA